MTSVSAVPRRRAVANLTISSYCWILLADQGPGDRAGQHRLQLGKGFRLASLRPIELLPVDRLQPWQQLEAEQTAEREGDFALAVAVDILTVDRHFGAVAQDTLHHRGHLRRRGGRQLG